jgi:hypothetical protein
VFGCDIATSYPSLLFKECHKCGSIYDFGCDVVVISSNNDSGCDDDDIDDDDNEYLGGGIKDTDHREHWCNACLNNNEGISKYVPITPTTRPGPSLSQENNTRRSSILAIMGTSARKVATLTTTANIFDIKCYITCHHAHATIYVDRHAQQQE